MSRPDSAMPLSPRLSIYRWRAPMLASLAHRASGIFLLSLVLLWLCLLHLAQGDAHRFDALLNWLRGPQGWWLLWLGGASLIYHWCNGLRFLLLDAGIIGSRSEMRISAMLALAFGLLGLGLMGWWL